MKKARIMLLATASFASAAIALAFKAKEMGSTEYCYKVTTVQPLPGECKTCLAGWEFKKSSGGMLIYYTTTTNCENCANAKNLPCTRTAHIPFNN